MRVRRDERATGDVGGDSLLDAQRPPQTSSGPRGRGWSRVSLRRVDSLTCPTPLFTERSRLQNPTAPLRLIWVHHFGPAELPTR
jgi:hypothetical protein